MEIKDWEERWRQGRRGWHQEAPNKLLLKYGPAALGKPPGRVLVPLCGKSLDLLWLEEQGFWVLGVEAAGMALREFHQEHDRQVAVREEGPFKIHQSGRITLVEGDFLALPDGLLGQVDAIYDRAAYHAVGPREVRDVYAQRLLEHLKPAGSMLLIALHYNQQQMPGPPFSVTPEEVREVFGGRRPVRCLHDQEILAQEPGLQEKGLSEVWVTACAIGPSTG